MSGELSASRGRLFSRLRALTPISRHHKGEDCRGLVSIFRGGRHGARSVRERGGPRKGKTRAPLGPPGSRSWNRLLGRYPQAARASPELKCPKQPIGATHHSPGSGLLTSLPPEGEPSPELPRPRYPSRRTDPVLRVPASCSRPDVASGTSTFCFASRCPRAPSRSRSVSSEEAPDDAAYRLTAWDVGQSTRPCGSRQYEPGINAGRRESFYSSLSHAQNVRRVIRSQRNSAVENPFGKAAPGMLVACPSEPERARYGRPPREE